MTRIAPNDIPELLRIIRLASRKMTRKHLDPKGIIKKSKKQQLRTRISMYWPTTKKTGRK